MEYSYAEIICDRESGLQYQWGAMASGTRLTTNDGRRIVIESPGTLNTEAGPDFLNARLVIDGIVMIGNVEIHRDAKDWYRHGHDGDPRYDNVILHVVQRPANNDLPPLSTLILDPEDCDDLFPEITTGDCAERIAELSDSDLRDILTVAGIERLTLKTEAVCRTAIRDGLETAALRMMFDAAGYKNNRHAFAELFNRWMRYPMPERRDHLAALLWGESGLLPDTSLEGACHAELVDAVRGLWEDFWKLREGVVPPLPWVRAGMRPFNNPERRLAALIEIIRRTEGNPARYWEMLFTQVTSDEDLVDALIESVTVCGTAFDTFWRFNSKAAKPAALQGTDRAREWVLNAVIPILCARAWIVKDHAAAERCKRLWERLPASQENHTLSIAVSRCFGTPQKHRAKKLMRSAVVQQGLTHLYLNYCELNQSVCGTCRMIHADD